MKITLKNGMIKEYDHPLSIIDIAKDINDGLARMACIGEIDGEPTDLRTIVSSDCSLNILTGNEALGLSVYRNTASQILANAVKRLYPDAKLATGASTENGFYYDFDMPPLSQSDLAKIEAEMKKIIKEQLPLEYFTLSQNEALEFMSDRNEPYKAELISALPLNTQVTFLRQDSYVDLCSAPHLINTKLIKSFKLLSSSGAYWKGNENNIMLTRIHGTAFLKKEELNKYLENLENLKNRDHNKLGRDLELFTTVDVIGQGLPLLMPNGAKIIQTLQRWIEDEEDLRRGYMRTKTPLMAKKDLYVISDHWEHYKDGMFVLGDENQNKEVFALRPMTCPFQYYIYKSGQKSYRDLPCRYSETSTLFRNEDSGEMHGLTRVRQFTISEGHLVLRPDQLETEFNACVDLTKYCLTTLGLQNDVTYRMSKWDPNNADHYLGTPELWTNVESTMRTILDNIGLDYTEAVGEAAFYGPKLDIQAKNVYGKEDTMITIQIDMFLAERFDMSYIDADGSKKRPYIIHRTSIGCYERTLAWLIEKYEGAFPTWLCPEQVRILPISEKYHNYARQIEAQLKENNILCTIDERSEKIGYKIREARLKKLPYMLIVGQQEEENKKVSVRSRFLGDEGEKDLQDFLSDISYEIKTKQIRKVEEQVSPE